jgi:hypothetical protein
MAFRMAIFCHAALRLRKPAASIVKKHEARFRALGQLPTSWGFARDPTRHVRSWRIKITVRCSRSKPRDFPARPATGPSLIEVVDVTQHAGRRTQPDKLDSTVTMQRHRGLSPCVSARARNQFSCIPRPCPYFRCRTKPLFKGARVGSRLNDTLGRRRTPPQVVHQQGSCRELPCRWGCHTPR